MNCILIPFYFSPRSHPDFRKVSSLETPIFILTTLLLLELQTIPVTFFKIAIIKNIITTIGKGMKPLKSYACPNGIKSDMNVWRKVTIPFKFENINN